VAGGADEAVDHRARLHGRGCRGGLARLPPHRPGRAGARGRQHPRGARELRALADLDVGQRGGRGVRRLVARPQPRPSAGGTGRLLRAGRLLPVGASLRVTIDFLDVHDGEAARTARRAWSWQLHRQRRRRPRAGTAVRGHAVPDGPRRQPRGAPPPLGTGAEPVRLPRPTGRLARHAARASRHRRGRPAGARAGRPVRAHGARSPLRRVVLRRYDLGAPPGPSRDPAGRSEQETYPFGAWAWTCGTGSRQTGGYSCVPRVSPDGSTRCSPP
jgi:hypothetical protein